MLPCGHATRPAQLTRQSVPLGDMTVMTNAPFLMNRLERELEFDASLLPLPADSEGCTLYCSPEGSVYTSPDLFTPGPEAPSANGHRHVSASCKALPAPAAVRCSLQKPSLHAPHGSSLIALAAGTVCMLTTRRTMPICNVRGPRSCSNCVAVVILAFARTCSDPAADLHLVPAHGCIDSFALARIDRACISATLFCVQGQRRGAEPHGVPPGGGDGGKAAGRRGRGAADGDHAVAGGRRAPDGGVGRGRGSAERRGHQEVNARVSALPCLPR